MKPTISTETLWLEPADRPDYRAEVDGLRAIAVLAIVLFHLGVDRFSGGFVGVDIFFVISGYLVTRNIRGGLERSDFRFRDFYRGRIRRLLPALAATLLATLIVGAFLLSPEHYQGLGRTTLLALFSLSNFAFWIDGGYFDIAAEFKPLLHTWSLGVEEQIYIIWPAILVMLHRIRGAFEWNRIAIVAIAFASLGLAEWMLRDDPSAAYFLMPSRLTEFAIGALCVEFDRRHPRGWRAEALVLAGLVLIAWSVFRFRADTVFPGMSAMIPCLGSALVIHAARESRFRALLGWWPLVWIGLISYSVYLVHWPLIVFYKYVSPGDLERTDQILLAAVTLVFAAALNRFVEAPYRRPTEAGRSWRTAAIGPAILIGVIVLSSAVWLNRGFPQRMDHSMQAAAASLPDMVDRHFEWTHRLLKEPFPMPNRRNAIIIGDSHGADLLGALVLTGSDVHYRHLPAPHQCHLTHLKHAWGEGTGIGSRSEAEICDRASRDLRDSSDLEAADLIVISMSWTRHALAELPELLAILDAKYEAPVVLTGPRFFFTDPGQVIAGAHSQTDANRTFDAAKNAADTSASMRRLEEVARKHEVPIIDLRSIVCAKDDGEFFCPLFHADGSILYSDWHHWSERGRRIFGSRLKTSVAARGLFED